MYTAFIASSWSVISGGLSHALGVSGADVNDSPGIGALKD